MTDVQSFTVVAAVIRDAEGRILLTRRPHGRHMGGLWEFPGGKVKDGEAPAAALVRELAEELGVNIEVEDPITFATHDEPGMHILLLFYTARISGGDLHPHEQQAIAWVTPQRLDEYPTPPADAELVRRLMAEDQP